MAWFASPNMNMFVTFFLVLLRSQVRAQNSKINFAGGYAPAEWSYNQNGAVDQDGIYGWSYYMRAFNLLTEQPTQEIGWGQWSKPASPVKKPLTRCGRHPAGFVCEETNPDLTSNCPCTTPDDETCQCLQNCGATDYLTRRDCKYWVCNLNDLGGMSGSIEGGMGYWMYTLETPHVKYNLPGSTSSNYEIFGGTMLNDRMQDCTRLGGAVRISNRLIVPNDFIMFSGGNETDGFLGYMLSRTPIGKRSDTDDANYWTIILDAANYGGPAMMMSSFFWDVRSNWDPESASWSDPRSLIGYIAQGFEGGLGSFQTTRGTKTWRRTTKYKFPIDKDATSSNPTSTLFTGHSQYNTDWAATAMEPMLAGTGDASSQTVEYVKTQASTNRTKPDCNLATSESEFNFGIESDGIEHKFKIGIGLIPSDTAAALNEANVANCHMKLEINVTQFDCTSMPGWCQGRRYLSIDSTGTEYGDTHADADVPSDVKTTLETNTFEPTKKNDGRFLGPPHPLERSCFECPGPAQQDSQLYCVRTVEGTWIGFKWYRFVDQPELNQVFAAVPVANRDAVKCYMQQRIERLHAAAGTWNTPWFEPPQGSASLPADKVSIDDALLVTPPTGMEVGFVPIPVYNRLRTKPSECDVTLGTVTVEPDPLPSTYFGAEAVSNTDRDQEICNGNTETGGTPFPYPGTIYPFSHDGGGPLLSGYTVPLRENVATNLPSISPTCGLSTSDPPSGAVANTDFCGASATKSACTGTANGMSCENGGIPTGLFFGTDMSECSCRCYGWGGATCTTELPTSTPATTPVPDTTEPPAVPDTTTPASVPDTTPTGPSSAPSDSSSSGTVIIAVGISAGVVVVLIGLVGWFCCKIQKV